MPFCKIIQGTSTAGVFARHPQAFGSQPHPSPRLHKLKGELCGKYSVSITREDTHKAFNLFVGKYEAKYPKAVKYLEKDRKELLAFYDFPAEHWQHIRTSNPIEPTFATVRLRTAKTRGCVSRATTLAMVFKLGQSAQKR
jgi:hypothetical protein